jgi:CheY-like chemotaxis protein
VGALVNVQVRELASVDEALAARPRLAAIFVASDLPARTQEGPPLIRLRAPTSSDGASGTAPALLLPPRRARVVRILRRARAPGRDTGRDAAPVVPTGLRALVVDDEPVNLKVASLLLSRSGWSTTTAASGEEALAIARGPERIDAVLVDLDMPGLDGVETVRALASAARTGRRPWLVLQTASIEDSARARALDAGATDFLAKPVEAERLRDVLERAARHRRVEDLRDARGLAPAPREAVALPLLALLPGLTVAVIAGEIEVAMAALGELQLDARRRQLERIDRACTALHDALLESDGLEALVDLELAVASFAREASVAEAAGI